MEDHIDLDLVYEFELQLHRSKLIKHVLNVLYIFKTMFTAFM